MAVNWVHRFVCFFVAASLAIATVWTSDGASAGMMGPHPAATAILGDMTCPGCDMMKVSISGCTQMSCVSPAVIAESGTFFEAVEQAFFPATALVPDEIASAPPTPPI